MTDQTPSQAEGEPDTGTDRPTGDRSSRVHDTGHTDPGHFTPSQAEGERDAEDETGDRARGSGRRGRGGR
ncbi:hypothetical protein ACFV6E_30595 [Streptomyces sp. NPDC059785]|uniref:hypothetical protein n=1 Tax=unclassified Streptomyces TaxID=2593676 RepID=UPI003651EB41